MIPPADINYSCEHRPEWNVDLPQGSKTPIQAGSLTMSAG